MGMPGLATEGTEITERKARDEAGRIQTSFLEFHFAND
jgi:hypothetical protein